MKLTIDQVCDKLIALGKEHPLKRVQGKNPSREYYQVEDLLLDFYDCACPYDDVAIIYRGFGVYYTKSREEMNLLYRTVLEIAKKQIEKEFE